MRALLTTPANAMIALDFDGTLAPIVDRPQDARALPEAVPTLARIAKHVCVVAIVTGRPAIRAIELGGFRGAAGLESMVIVGQYGRERWDAATDTMTDRPVPPDVEVVRKELPALLADAPDGVSIEDKGAALVVHTRRTADPAATLATLEPRLTALADKYGLIIERARLALELRPPGFDKGRALRQLVQEYAARVVVFVGDDLGDLPAYDTVEALRGEGVAGLTVASASAEEPALTERADIVVDGPHGVIDFLDELARALATR
ncbi:MAG: trehalose 6-phosphate phosphatase [Frankiales bacterium]|jgi:trehalose 6-phosphate phosphatase|nr:trehalose 6-phosphate phosphatase [Frankiales bacterium]